MYKFWGGTMGRDDGRFVPLPSQYSAPIFLNLVPMVFGFPRWIAKDMGTRLPSTHDRSPFTQSFSATIALSTYSLLGSASRRLSTGSRTSHEGQRRPSTGSRNHDEQRRTSVASRTYEDQQRPSAGSRNSYEEQPIRRRSEGV